MESRMRSRTITVPIGFLTCLAVASGCTSTNPGQAEPGPAGVSGTLTVPPSSGSSPSPTSSVNGSLPSDGAPKVNNPLDASRFQRNPCGTLTSAQLQALNLPSQGAQRDAPLGPECEWRNPTSDGSVTAHFSIGNPDGLSAVYRANKAGQYKFFTVLPAVEGYPAVAFGVVDARDQGDCSVSVGLTDALIFDVSVHLSTANVGKKDPCAVTAQVAGMAVQTMKAGG
jgi:hypothetical protein